MVSSGDTGCCREFIRRRLASRAVRRTGETGFLVNGLFIALLLLQVRQPSGKVIVAWAAADLDLFDAFMRNTFDRMAAWIRKHA